MRNVVPDWLKDKVYLDKSVSAKEKNALIQVSKYQLKYIVTEN